jgi:hypothetical protein
LRVDLAEEANKHGNPLTSNDLGLFFCLLKWLIGSPPHIGLKEVYVLDAEDMNPDARAPYNENLKKMLF